MSDKLKFISLAVLISLGACSTYTADRGTDTEAAIATPVVETPATGLPGQVLSPGECGLFLWTRREQPDFVFFSKAGTEDAVFWVEGETLTLSRIAFGGDIFGQELTEQDFATEDGRIIELRMTPGDLLVGGQRIPEASLTIIDAEGWRTLTPVAGVTACQTER